MIYGTGTDLVAIDRIRRASERHGERFAAHLLAPAEMDAYRAAPDAARFLAKRFAAKEALAKALGTGLRHPVTLTALAITHDALGKPALHPASEALAQWLASRRLTCHLSISDEETHALAFAIAEQSAAPPSP